MTNFNLPPIPYEDAFKFKHYYIAQDKKEKNTFHLYLFEYEPSTLFLSDTGFIRANQKYGYIINIKRYKYNGSKDTWGSSSTTTTSHNYSDLVDSLIYNNFTMRIEGDYYKNNPMPDDQLVEPVIPQFPSVPHKGLTEYKHYLIAQSKSNLDTYNIYLFRYEPVLIQASDSGKLAAYQQYGKVLTIMRHHFTFGGSNWSVGSVNNVFLTYEDLIDTLTYSNFNMEINGRYFEQKPMPGDNVIPAPSFALPPIPKITNAENDYRHYALVQDTSDLEKYSIYLLKDKPVDYMLNNGKTAVHFINEEGKIIPMRHPSFSLGNDDWKSLASVTNSIPISTFNEAGLYNNFKIQVFDSDVSTKSISRSATGTCLCEADVRIYADDGVSNSSGTTGWVKCTRGWHYYHEGEMSNGYLGWLELGGNTYFLDGENNWLRVQNDFKKIRASTYYFKEDGVMITGPGHYINGQIYNFDIYGRLISTGWDNRTEDYFVINKLSNFRIRSSTSEENEDNVIKLLPPGRGLKVVLPLNEIKVGKTTWIEVYTDKTKTQTGWGNKSNIYPDLPIEHLFREHPTRDYRDITGIFTEKNADDVLEVNTKTLDYVKNWGAPGKGKKYPQTQNKDERGRFRVAVAPKILYPDYPSNGAVDDDDFNGFSKDITVHLKNIKGGDDRIVPCVVYDLKAHSYEYYPHGHNNPTLHPDTEGYVEVPSGLVQTGIAYPKSSNAVLDLACSSEHMNGTVVEFCSHVVDDFECTDYELIKIMSNEEKHTQY